MSAGLPNEKPPPVLGALSAGLSAGLPNRLVPEPAAGAEGAGADVGAAAGFPNEKPPPVLGAGAAGAGVLLFAGFPKEKPDDCAVPVPAAGACAV